MTEVTVENFINGKFLTSETYLDSIDPSTGKVWAKIPDSGADDVELAVVAAKSAFNDWASLPVEKRSALLLKVADLLEEKLEEFAEAESRDQGKPVSLARAVDIPRAVLNYRFFANATPHQLEQSHYQDATNALNYVTRSPVGVAGLISPWNLPLYLLTFKMAPALVAGNTVVCKPSEFTSVTAWMFCRLHLEAGFPPGVVNMVFGTGPKAGQALVAHPDVPLISFTGSTATAERIRACSAHLTKKYSLELGGKNAAVIFDDADLDKCIPTTVRSAFSNQGEICLCTSRVYVQRGIFQGFLEKYVRAAKALNVGDPRKPSTNVGALISEAHYQKVDGFVQLARQENRTIVCGHTVDELQLEAENRAGYFLQPTVITDVPDNSALMQDEIFGPVVCVVPFDTEEEVIQRANGVRYGLCATLWTQDVNRLHRVAGKLNVGTVWCNCWLVRDLHMPFGGTKESGTGRESATDSLDFYTEKRTVCLQL